MSPRIEERGQDGEIMNFLSTDNPIALLLAAILVFAVLKVSIAKVLKKTTFGKKHADFVSAIIVVIGLLMVTSISFLKAIAIAVPYLTLIIMFILLTIFLFLAFNVEPKKIPLGLNVLKKNTYLWIVILLVVVWGISAIWGPSLLESGGTTTFTGFVTHEEQPVDTTFVFAKPFLGFVLVFAIIGSALFVLNKSS